MFDSKRQSLDTEYRRDRENGQGDSSITYPTKVLPEVVDDLLSSVYSQAMIELSGKKS